jgi:hypothetical protein
MSDTTDGGSGNNRSSDDSFEMAFDISKEDVKTYYDDYGRYYEKSATSAHKRSRRPSYFAYYALLFGVPLLIIGIASSVYHVPYRFGAIFFVTMVWSWPFGSLYNWWNLRSLGKTNDFLGEHRVRIDSEGLTIRSDLMAWTLFWRHIEDITVTKHHILFVGDAQSEGTVYPIPLHTFSDRAEAERFVAQAIRLWKNAPT